ncbi:MAG: carbohydrate kinase family protein [Thermomicrobiales bacterium]|nr:carbohydrate kinase family protein [Thermomicrobiales bacterium]
MAVGLASWDRLIVVDQYPAAGGFAVVRDELTGPGGTTTNAVVTMARLGASVSIRAIVGDDEAGRSIRTALASSGVNVDWLTISPDRPTDAATVIVSSEPRDRTIFWHRGAHLVRGDRIDIAGVFAHDVVLLDVDDAPLRRFLLDLPAHTLPTTRLLGTLTYLDDAGVPDAFDQLMRHDAVVGNARELMAITSSVDLDEAISRVRGRMRGENLRAAIITLGIHGSLAFDVNETWSCPAFPVDVIDTTGAGDAFAGAVAFGMADRWAWPAVLRFAGAVAALSITKLGAQTALPTWDEAVAFLAEYA